MSTVAVTTCPSCGSLNSVDARFCGECGSKCGHAHAAAPRVAPAAAPQVPPMGPGPAAIPTPNRATASGRNDSMVWVALLLAVGGVMLCGPFTTVPGCFIAWKEMSAAKAAGTPNTLATVALFANIGITALGVLAMGMFALFILASLAAV